MKNVYTIKELITLFGTHIWLIIAFTLFGGAAAYGFSAFVLPLQYSSHITIYVQSYTGVSEDNTNDVNNISNSKKLVNTYVEALNDSAVMSAVGDMLIEQYNINDLTGLFEFTDDGIDPDSIRRSLTISSVADTSAIKIIATVRNAKLAADICNDLIQVAPYYVEEAVGAGSVNTIDKAKIYRTPVSPDNVKNSLLGMATAFLIAVTIILIVDCFDITIKDSGRISKRYNKAVIGGIQQFCIGKKNGKSRNELKGLLIDKDVPFDVAESYKTIRTNIVFTAADHDKKVIAVSSPNTGEGKSTSAANLAIALAQSGSTVLLMDGDLRKAVLHRKFKVKNDKGLSTLIIKKSSLDNSIKSNVIKNLDLLPAGPLPPNPSELLTSDNFKALLEQLSKNYDYVIIDTPPVNAVSDAMIMKDSICGIILVIRYAKTTYEELSSCMRKIDNARVNMLGFIMNGVHHKYGSVYCNYKNK